MARREGMAPSANLPFGCFPESEAGGRGGREAQAAGLVQEASELSGSRDMEVPC